MQSILGTVVGAALMASTAAASLKIATSDMHVATNKGLQEAGRIAFKHAEVALDSNQMPSDAYNKCRIDTGDYDPATLSRSVTIDCFKKQADADSWAEPDWTQTRLIPCTPCSQTPQPEETT